MGIADDDMPDASLTRDQDADLAAGFARDRGEMSRQLCGDDTLGRNAAPEGPVEGAPLRGLQSTQIAGNGVSGDELSPAFGGANSGCQKTSMRRRLPDFCHRLLAEPGSRQVSDQETGVVAHRIPEQAHRHPREHAVGVAAGAGQSDRRRRSPDISL